MQPTILEKYGEARLPRYPSYPPAPRFSAAVGADTYDGWLSGLPTNSIASNSRCGVTS